MCPLFKDHHFYRLRLSQIQYDFVVTIAFSYCSALVLGVGSYFTQSLCCINNLDICIMMSYYYHVHHGTSTCTCILVLTF